MLKHRANYLIFFAIGISFFCPTVLLAAPAAFSITFHGSIASAGEKAGQTRDPSGIAVFGKSVFVSDTGNHRLQVFSLEGNVQKVIGQKGKKNGEFSSPRGLAVHEDGELYVADRGNSRIQVFAADGSFIRTFGRGLLSKPVGVSLGPNERLFVADEAEGKVFIFSRDGIFLGTQGKPGKNTGELREPVALVALHDGSVIVADQDTLIRLQQGVEQGELLCKGQFTGLWADDEDRIYGFNQSSSQINILDSQGRLLHAFGSAGEGRGQLAKPLAITFPVSPASSRGSEDKQLWIANTGNQRLDRYALKVGHTALLFPKAKDLPRFSRGKERHADVIAEAHFEDDAFFLNPRKGEVLREDSSEKRLAYLAFRKVGRDTAESESLRGFAVALASGETKELLFYLSEEDHDLVHVFNRKGEEKFVFGGSGSSPGQLKRPAGMQFFRDELYVADTGNRRVQVFSKDGVFLREFKTKSGEMKKPRHLALSRQGNLFIADPSANKIIRFSSDGTEQGHLLSIHDLQTPDDRFSEVVSLTIDTNDWLYILERRSQGYWVHIRDAMLNFLWSFHVDGEDFSPSAMGVDTAEKIRLTLFDSEHGKEREYWINPVLPATNDFSLVINENETHVTWVTAEESFLEKHRIYQLRDPADRFPTLVAEGKIGALILKRPVGDPPYWFAASRLSKEGLESAFSRAVRDYYHEGLRAYERGDDEAAVQAFAAQSKVYGLHGPSLKYLALTFIRNGKEQNAEKIYDLLAQIPEYKNYSEILKGRMYLQSHQVEKAEQLFRDLRIRQPDSEDVLIGLAESLAAQGQLQRAIATLKEAMKISPKSARAFALTGNYYFASQLFEKAKEAYEKALALSPEEAPSWIAFARTQYALGESEAAVSSYAKALKLNPGNLDALVGLTELYLDKKRYADAERFLDGLSEEWKSKAQVKALQGRLLAARGKMEDAIAMLEAVAEDGKAGAEIYLELGELYETRGYLEKAAKSYGKALEQKKQDPVAWVSLGSVSLLLKNYDQAEKAFHQALSYDPNSGTALMGLGNIRYAQKQFFSAAEWYAKAMLARDLLGSSELRLKMGLALAAQKKFGEAITILEEAIRLDPKSSQAHYELGRVTLENSFLVKAETAFRQAIVLEPGKAEFHHGLGEVYLKRYKLDEATAAFAEAARLKPDEERYREDLNLVALKKKQTLETNPNAPPIEVLAVQIQKIFAAIYKYYASHPLGEFKFRNNTEQKFNKLSVSFLVKDFMDFPATFTFKELAAHEILTVPLKVSFSNRILEISEDTVVQAQVKITYFLAREKKDFEQTVSLKIFGRTALVWNDADMVGAFITPKDGPVVSFARGVEKQFRAEGIVSELATGMKVFAALGALKLGYVVDPNNPYEKVNAKVGAVDNVQFPRDTLRLKSGDCDDLVVLYASLLESLGIETQLVEVPGHLMILFRTPVASSQFQKISSNKDLLVMENGSVWIPVEMTLVGNPFHTAWYKGAELYRRYEASKQVTLVSVHEAWKRYEPVSLPALSRAADLPGEEAFSKLLSEDLDLQKRKRLEKDMEPYLARLQADDRDSEARIQMGLAYVKSGVYSAALQQFQEVLKREPKNLLARVNLGNVYLKQGDTDQAIQEYLKAENDAKMDPEIKLNLAIAYYRKKAFVQAKEKFRDAEKLAPDLAQDHAYLRGMLFD